MKLSILLILLFLVQSLWCQEVDYDEENGFLKITESFRDNIAKFGKDLKKVTYIRAGFISSIQLTVDNADKPIVLITTGELVGNGYDSEYKVYSIPAIDDLKKIEREIDKVLTKLKITKIDQ